MMKLLIICAQDELRDDPLCHVKLPLMFIRGTRDPFSTNPAFQSVINRLESIHVEVRQLVIRSIRTRREIVMSFFPGVINIFPEICLIVNL